MSRISVKHLLAVHAFAAAVTAATGCVPKSWKQIKAPTLRAFKPQQPVRIDLKNGMVIFLQEDHELPLVAGAAYIRGGSNSEPAEKVGLLDVYGYAWRTGGTKNRTGDALDDYLESRAAKVETGSDDDSTSISFSCLKQDFGDVFKAFLDLLRNPSFRQDKIRLAKRQLFAAIARRNDSIGGIASREAAKLVYGKASPLARHAEYATVRAITREDLFAWHRRTVHPNNIILGIAGDFDGKAMEARLRAAFDAWPQGTKMPPAKPEIAPPKPGMYFVSKEDVNQSEVRLVDLGITRRNPDYFAVQVMNQILGGGFSSRLFANVRSRKGLAYAVGGGVGSDWIHRGAVSFRVGTKSQSTAAAIDAILIELQRIQGAPVTVEELKTAKEMLLNSFIFRYSSKIKLLYARIRYEFYGYPIDFLERFRAGVERVTAADIQRVAQKYIHKNKLRILVVGKQKDFDRPLTTFGKVTRVDITIPRPTGG